jgi:hypothetical protein
MTPLFTALLRMEVESVLQRVKEPAGPFREAA